MCGICSAIEAQGGRVDAAIQVRHYVNARRIFELTMFERWRREYPAAIPR
jgi:hypothetical protein